MTVQPRKGRTAALFNTTFLDHSQVFVHEELRQHKRWRMEVFCARRRSPELFPWDPVHVAGILYPYTRYDCGFERLFQTGRFSLVHGHFGTGSVYALRYAQLFELPLVTTFHGYDVPLIKSDRRLHPKHWRYGLLSPGLLRRLDLALCASSELREMVVEYGVPDDRAVVHRLGVDLERFTPSPRGAPRDHVKLIQVGRFVEKKAHGITLRAFARVLGRGHRVHLTLIGGGDASAEAAVRQLADDLGVTADVTFAGVLSHTEVARHLADSDVLLCPSVTAGNGDRESGVLVIKEAAACAVPAVATWHGGIPEIIEDGHTGYLVPERAVAPLVDRIERLVADPALRETFGREARRKMEREYDNRAVVARLEDYYDDVVDRWQHRSAGRGARPLRPPPGGSATGR